MKTDKNLKLYWFSASGNTLLAAETFAQRLRELGWNVELKPIERSNPAEIDPSAMLGLAFSTHCFSIPEMIRDFVRNLPQVDGTPAMMLGTHGAVSGGVLGPMKRLLTSKGFRCVFGRIFSMPDSFFPFCSRSFNKRHLAKSLERVRRHVEQFDAGRTRWSRWPVVSDLCDLFFSTFFASRKLCGSFGTTVHAKNSKCIRCDTCVKYCPKNALSRNTGDAVPRTNRNCVNCLRCVAVCPVDAMRHLIGFSPYRAEDATDWKKHIDREL